MQPPADRVCGSPDRRTRRDEDHSSRGASRQKWRLVRMPARGERVSASRIDLRHAWTAHSAGYARKDCGCCSAAHSRAVRSWSAQPASCRAMASMTSAGRTPKTSGLSAAANRAASAACAGWEMQPVKRPVVRWVFSNAGHASCPDASVALASSMRRIMLAWMRKCEAFGCADYLVKGR